MTCHRVLSGTIKLTLKLTLKINIMKLSLEEFKALNAEIQEVDVLSKIEGGAQSDCHGFWGGIRKYMEMPTL